MTPDVVCRDQACTARHCVTGCGRHLDPLDQCCIHCLGACRRWLRAIPDHAAQISQGFGIANISSGIPNNDTGGGWNATKGHPLPGGDPLVMLGPGNDTGEYNRGNPAKGDPPDPTPVLWALFAWERDWRETIGATEAVETPSLPQKGPQEPRTGQDGAPAHSGPERATLTTVTNYLLNNLGWAAQHHPGFDDFHHEVKQLHNRLEHFAGASQRPVTDVTHCQDCPGVRLQKAWLPRTYDRRTHEVIDPGGLDDVWFCPSCKRRYLYAEYVLARKAYFEKLEAQKLAIEAAKAAQEAATG